VHAATAFVLVWRSCRYAYFGISWAAGPMRAMTRGGDAGLALATSPTGTGDDPCRILGWPD
jgi:hypothetical protein